MSHSPLRGRSAPGEAAALRGSQAGRVLSPVSLHRGDSHRPQSFQAARAQRESRPHPPGTGGALQDTGLSGTDLKGITVRGFSDRHEDRAPGGCGGFPAEILFI